MTVESISRLERSISPVLPRPMAEVALREAFCATLFHRYGLACLLVPLPQCTA